MIRMIPPTLAALVALIAIGFGASESAAAASASVSNAPIADDDGGPLLLENARVLDPAGTAFLEGYSVLIRDGRIARIAPESELRPGPTVARIDLGGRCLIPGLIDMHSHLLLHPYDETAWNDQVLKENLELRTLRAVPAARATLRAGFTTLRELGTEGAAFADVGLRDAIELGLIEGPRIFAATRALVATGCYGPSGFDPRVALPKGAQVADGALGVRIAVREQIAAGADWIKVYADYRRRPGDPATPTYSQAELDAIVDEASSAGLPVAAHATTDEAIQRAVLAGVTTIEHGYGASDATLLLMRERGVALCPTLAAGYSISKYAGWDGSTPEPDRVTDARTLMKRALAREVSIVCGSDVGVFAHGENALELELMVDYGMTPAAALRAATSVAAAVLRRDDLGRIAPGAIADLVVLEGDPLVDVHALRAVRLVMKGGDVARIDEGLVLRVGSAEREDEELATDRAEVLRVCQALLDAHNLGQWDAMKKCFHRNAILSWDNPERQSWPADRWIELLAEGGARVADFHVRHMERSVLTRGDSATVIARRETLQGGEVWSQLDTILFVRTPGGWRITLLVETGG